MTHLLAALAVPALAVGCLTVIGAIWYVLGRAYGVWNEDTTR